MVQVQGTASARRRRRRRRGRGEARFTPSLSAMGDPPRGPSRAPWWVATRSTPRTGDSETALDRRAERGVEHHSPETYQRSDRKQRRDPGDERADGGDEERAGRSADGAEENATAGGATGCPRGSGAAARCSARPARWPRYRPRPPRGGGHQPECSGPSWKPARAVAAATIGEHLPVIPPLALGIGRGAGRAAGDQVAGHEEGGEDSAATCPVPASTALPTTHAATMPDRVSVPRGAPAAPRRPIRRAPRGERAGAQLAPPPRSRAQIRSRRASGQVTFRARASRSWTRSPRTSPGRSSCGSGPGARAPRPQLGRELLLQVVGEPFLRFAAVYRVCAPSLGLM